MSALKISNIFTFQVKQLENKYSNPDISDNDENDKNDQDSDNFDDDGDDSSSSDDDAETTKNIRQAHQNVREEVFEKKMAERTQKMNARLAKTIVKSSGYTNQSSQNHHKIRELDEDEMKNDGNGITFLFLTIYFFI